jgi:ABC-type Fe3+/spermidine/putrescine transport system ATPase subunit
VSNRVRPQSLTRSLGANAKRVALDDKLKTAIIADLKLLLEENGIPVLLVTHDR